MHQRITWTIALIGALSFSAQANTGNASEGKLLYEQFRCAECHGVDGRTRPARNVAPLAGMNPDHIFIKTQRFIESRAHDNVLQGCGEPPSPIQIKKISDYLATLSR
jgi:cytochrome c553